MNKLEQIYSDIKEVRIQGATNVARAAVNACILDSSSKNIEKLKSLRPTEPMLSNAIDNIKKIGADKVLEHFDYAQNKINGYVLKLIKDNCVIYTHCHSTNVVKALIYAKKRGKKFSVCNTETRPLYQGRMTSEELGKAGIKVTQYVDSGMGQAIKESDMILLGCDAIINGGIINKIGSGTIAEIASLHKKPLYIIADSWKYSPKSVKIEERDFHEVWKKVKNVQINNPAFEKVDKKYIKAIISEKGILNFDEFLSNFK